MREKTVRQLWGRDFEIVKDGLAEAEVVTFITELTNERNALIKRQEHLTSMMRLAEKTVAEADKLAEELRKEAEEESKAKAAMVLAKAEREAQEIMEQKRAEMLATANREAAAIKAQAQQEADLLLKQYDQKVQAGIKDLTQKLNRQIVTELEKLGRQVLALQTEWEGPKLGSLLDACPTSSRGEPTATSVQVGPEQKETPSTPPGLEICDLPEQFQQAWGEAETDTTEPSSTEPASTTIAQQPHPAAEQTYASHKVALAPDKTATTYMGKLAIDVLPPFNPLQLVEIQRFLRGCPGIEISELRPKNGGYTIVIVMDRPTQLLNILKELPEVSDINESTDDKAVMAIPSEGRLRRLAVTLCQKP